MFFDVLVSPIPAPHAIVLSFTGTLLLQSPLLLEAFLLFGTTPLFGAASVFVAIVTSMRPAPAAMFRRFGVRVA
jgi:hypothetical protein